MNPGELYRSLEIFSTGRLLLRRIDFFIKSKPTPFGLLQCGTVRSFQRKQRVERNSTFKRTTNSSLHLIYRWV